MLKIAFLTLIAVVALGVWASAQDPGMPDSAAWGNTDCSPIYIEPGGFPVMRLWFKNDEDLGYAGFAFGADTATGWPRHLTLTGYFMGDGEWDSLVFSRPSYDEYPNYSFIRFEFWCDCGDPPDSPLNTDSAWTDIFTVAQITQPGDSLLFPGDTIYPVLFFDGCTACASPIIVIDQQSSDEAGDLPHEFAITHISPNPFNAQTNIYYTLPDAADVSLMVYDILGRKIEMLDMGYQNAGEHAITWDATGCNSGVYFARLIAGGRSHVGQMVLVK